MRWREREKSEKREERKRELQMTHRDGPRVAKRAHDLREGCRKKDSRCGEEGRAQFV